MRVLLTSFLNDKPTERHARAQATWLPINEMGMYILKTSRPPEGRSSKDIGDPRNLPYLKDMLSMAVIALDEFPDAKPDDVVVWTNDDVSLDPRILPYCKSIVRLHKAMSMRRDRPPGDKLDHIGREMFMFTSGWIKEHLDEIPEFFIGCPYFDLVIAALIRKYHGFKNTSLDNLGEDFYPADWEWRYALHEPHPSSWAGENEHKFPANIHNRRLAKEWCSHQCPTLRL